MEVLLQNLIILLREEFPLIRGLNVKAQQLQSTLETIQGFLIDAEKKYITQDAVRAWLEDLEKVAFDADNVLDEFHYHALHYKVTAMKEMTHKALSCFPSFDHTTHLPRIAHMIQEINTSFDYISKRAIDLHLQMAFAVAPAVPVAASKTDLFTDYPIFIGRDEDVPRLVYSITDSLEERMFSIVAVVGMGGMGKTTLTRKVFNHQRMKTRFGCQSWVYVSQTFDPLIILKKFLASLLSQTGETTGSMEYLLKRLQDALKAKTYLLVLDDVWNQDRSKWTGFINALSGVTSTKGNVIIITTRSREVASVVNPLKTHHLSGLSEEDCWSIIKAKAFGRGNVIPSEFEIIGRKISRRCQGLPLAAMVVGGVLRGKSDKEWLSIEQDWIEGDSIVRILRLSYDNLSPSSLKKCFSYCSIFPKGHRMVKQELIELWMAEGFLQPDGGNDMEYLGDRFVNVLVCNSLLQVAQINDNDDEDEEFYVMHDLVHDLAMSVLGSFKIRYMRYDDESSHNPKNIGNYLRTLFLQGSISEFNLSDLKSLHVLSFGENQQLLLSSIGKLIHLRRLDISKTKIEYLPDSIGELHHLQTLRANAYYLKELPWTLKYLISLRHIYIRDGVKLPPDIGRLTSLRTLTHFTVGNENGCRIEELGRLTNLKGKLKISNLEKVQGKEEAEKANIFHNPSLFHLILEWNDNREKGEIHDENVLEGLQPHPNLRKLKIVGYRAKKFPSGSRGQSQGTSLLTSLEIRRLCELECLPNWLFHNNQNMSQLTISECHKLRELPDGLCTLNSLVELTIDCCPRLKSIDSPTGSGEQSTGTLLSLTRLHIEELQELECLPAWLFHNNQNLSKLTIVGCHKLRELPDGLCTLSSLVEFTIRCCKILKTIGRSIGSEGQLTLLSLTKFHIEELFELECLPDWLFHNNQNLSELSIEACDKLRELPDGLCTLNSLVKLTIKDCPNLRLIGSSIGNGGQSQVTLLSLKELHIKGLYELECLPDWLFHNNQNLSKLTIAYCHKLIELPDGLRSLNSLVDLRIYDCNELIYLPHELFDSLVPLEVVRLSNLSSLENLHKVIECLTKSGCLEELRIAGVPKFMVAGSVKSWSFGSLRRLDIDASVEWSSENDVAIKETFDGMLQGCSNSLQLQYLKLKGLEIWKSLPESIQTLTSLSTLRLSNFGIEELPQGLDNLSSLERLFLSNCKRLRRLSGIFSKLDSLHIDDCPALHIDSVWLSKNSLTAIYVDRTRIHPSTQIMEGGAATAMKVIFQNVMNMSKEEIFLIQGLHKESQQLENNLRKLQGYLNDAEKKYITQHAHAVIAWLLDLEQVAFDADNVLDELNYYALHDEVKTPSCFSSCVHIPRRRRIARQIKEINTAFDSIDKRATDLQLQSMLVDATAAAVPIAAFETDSNTLKPIFVGRDDDVQRLVNLMTGSLEERKFSILAVMGMGGMGKTTLTWNVLNHQKLKTRFGCHSWVYVSQTFDPLVILKKLLASLTSQTDEDKNREEPTGSKEVISLKLQKSFKAEFDEFETRGGILKKLQEALKSKTYLLVLDDVWNEDLTKWTDFMNALSGVTSTMGNGIIITTRSTEVASVVNPLETHRLNGLSDEDCWSIIKAKAFLMSKVIPSEFETVGRKISRGCQGLPLAAMVVGGVLRGKSEQEWLSIEQTWIEEDTIFGILRLGYDNLSSSSLKRCFSYCTIFPKGCWIGKQELIELWMAEGFLQPDGGNDMESLGDKFVNVLECNSLLQVVPRNDDDDEDKEFYAMHDLVHDFADSMGSFKVRYMRHDDESSHFPKDTGKYLRTLFLQGNMSEYKFSDFKCLHALHFGENQELLSSSIRKLIHLRRLNISDTKIKYLPDSIGELHHLQTLRANALFLRKLPRTLKYLISLRHLYIRDEAKLPPEIGRLTSLQTLTHFTVGNEYGCRIEELGSLTNLKGKLRISNLEKVQGKEEAEKANIFKNPNLSDLVFEWNDNREEGEMHDENVLEGLQPHQNLKKLKIVGFRGKRFPLWTANMAVRDQPRHSWVGNPSTSTGESQGTSLSLTNLHINELSELECLPDWLFHKTQNLSKLTISGCSKLRKLPDGLYTLNSLVELTIHNCSNLKSLGSSIGGGGQSQATLLSLTKLYIEGLHELECLPDWLFYNNQNLSKLTIAYCHKLIELPRLRTLNSLVELRISHCDRLIYLPHEIFAPWSLLEIVWLINLSSVMNLPKVIKCLTKSDYLNQLRITGVPKFMVAGSVMSWPFGSLRRLEIDGSVEWSSENNVDIKETLDGMLQGCSYSLTWLELKGLEIWKSLPESIQNLTSLCTLSLDNFGIEELPEWLENLFSLKSLSLRNCKQLRCLDGSLNNLDYLEINDCPALDIGFVWLSNNSFIDIYVDGSRIQPPTGRGNRCLKLTCL